MLKLLDSYRQMDLNALFEVKALTQRDHMRFLIVSTTAITLLTAVSGPTARAAIIGFDGIRDATPVSAGNPYAGVLTIDARLGWIPFGATELQFLPSLIWGEQIDTNIAAPGNPVVQMSEMTATFSQPVADVSFDGWATQPTVYEYFGANGSGETFTGSGTILVPFGTFELVPVDLTLPSGYFLTHFKITNTNPGGLGYDFRVDNIAFTLASAPGGENSVPDSGQTGLLLGMSCMALAVLGKRLRLAS